MEAIWCLVVKGPLGLVICVMSGATATGADAN